MMNLQGTFLLLASLLSSAHSQVRAPPYFNVAYNKPIQSTSTCGISADGKPLEEEYCQLTLTKEAEQPTCGVCNAALSDARHPIEFAVDSGPQWWQSPPLTRGEGYHQVNITISLGQVFHVAYVIVQVGNSPRPGRWVLERSQDGVTFTPWQYFVERDEECKTYFDTSSNQVLTDQAVLCTADYSKPVPLTNGQIFVSLVNGRPGVETFSQSLQEWTSASYVRLRLLRVITLKGELLTQNAYEDASLSRRYYYSVKEIIVGGRCTCNGHSNECPEPELVCLCLHNTCGPTCGECCEGYNQYKWRPRLFDNNFSCEKCNCHGHSSECIYNSTVAHFNLSLNLAGESRGGGVCQDCANHTAGINCEQCKHGYFRTPDLTKQDACLKCNCTGLGVLDGSCNGTNNGHCVCKQNVEGFYCDKCKPGFYGLSASNPLGCEPCSCDKRGIIVGTSECGEMDTCPCKALATTQTCSECVDGTFGLSAENVFGCQFCQCDIGGSSQPFNCNKGRGKCQCHPGIEGKRCNYPVKGTCLPSFHRTMRFEAENGLYRSFKTPFAFNETEFPGYTSLGYVILQTGPENPRFQDSFQDMIEIEVFIPGDGNYRFVIRYILQSESNSKVTVSIKQTTLSSSIKTQEIRLSNESYSSTGDFFMTEGSWQVQITYNDRPRLLIDHVAVLPEAYYNPKMLYAVVSEMCSIRHQSYLCRDYAYPSLSSFPLKSVPETILPSFELHGKPVLLLTSQNTTLGFESVPNDDNYVMIVSYFSRSSKIQTIQVVTESEESVGVFDINFLPCMFQFGCRQVGVMASGNVAQFVVSGEVTVRIGGAVEDRALFIESVFLVPMSSWSPVLIRPALYCYRLMGSCIPTDFTPLSEISTIHSLIADDGYIFDSEGNRQDVPISSNPEVNRLSGSSRGAAKLSTIHQELLVDIIVDNPGDYYAIIHYHNPDYSTVYVSVDVNGVEWQLNLPFCPDKSGCRVTTMSHGLLDDPTTLSVSLLERKALYVYTISLIDLSQTQDYMTPRPVDLNARFINNCSSNGFLVTSLSSSFCQVSARSLSAYYHQGSLNCLCHPNGSVTTECDENTCECQCKENVVGDHCTQCKVGFYGFPNCHPCQCSDGSVCDETTGQCVCPPNVQGRKCDRCVSRFWGFHSVQGCIPCGCNPITSARLTCRRNSGRCTCKANFTGRTCDECVAGKYDPPTCRYCGCFPGGSVGVACDQRTGQCQCKANVAGRVCDRCAIDAFNFRESNPDGCQLCNCDPDGSTSPSCDQLTGQCVCKLNRIGLKCDQCAPNTFHFRDGSCRPCNCHPVGSRSETCDVRAGRCPCKRFVRGRQCKRCLRNYYGLGINGCKPCECSDLGSLSTECNSTTGQCNCKTGSFGRKCDMCAPRHVIGEDGCRACGQCTNTLMDAIEAIFHRLNDTLLNVTNYSILVTAWRRLTNLEKEYNTTRQELLDFLKDLDETVEKMFGSDTDMCNGSKLCSNSCNSSELCVHIHQLQEAANRLEPTINSTTKQSASVELNTTQTATKAGALLTQASNLEDRLNNVITSLRQLRELMDQTLADYSFIFNEGIRIRDTILSRDLDFDEAKQATNDAVSASMMQRSAVMELLNETKAWMAKVLEVQMVFSVKIRLLEEAKTLATNASVSVNHVLEIVKDVEERLSDVMSELVTLDLIASDGNVALSRAESSIEKASSLIGNATAISQLAAEARKNMEMYQVEVLRFIYNYRRNVSFVGPPVSQAMRRARRVSNHARTAKRMYDAVWNEAKGPMDQYYKRDFPDVPEILLNVTTQNMRDVMSINESLLDRAIASLNRSRVRLQEAQANEQKLTTIEGSLNVIASNDSHLREEHRAHRVTLTSTQQMIEQQENRVAIMNGPISALESNNTLLEELVTENVERVRDDQVECERAEKELDAFLKDLTRVRIPNLEQRVNRINSSLTSMANTQGKIEARFIKAEKILGTLDEKIDKILDIINRAKRQAERVNIPSSLAGKQAIAVSPPDIVAQPLAHTAVSMNVRRSSNGGLLFYIGEATKASGKRRRDAANDHDFIAIELNKGIPVLIMRIGGKPVRIELKEAMGRNEWNRIDLTRMGKTARLELIEFTGSKALTDIRKDINSVVVSHDALNISHNSNIFLGGIPSQYNVPDSVTKRYFEGCIDYVKFNSRLVPMFGFVGANHEPVSHCSSSNGTDRKILIKQTDGLALTGIGYIALPNNVLIENSRELKIRLKKFQTYQLNGLLFYAHGDNGKFLSIEVQNGLLLAQFNNGGETVNITLDDVPVVKGTGLVDLVHDDKRVAFVKPLDDSATSPAVAIEGKVDLTSPAYFGGVPDDVDTPPGVTRQGLHACVGSLDIYRTSRKTFKLNDEELFVSGSNGYSLKSCPVEVLSCATFDGLGHVVVDHGGLVGANSSYVSVYPARDTGVIAFHGSEDTSGRYAYLALDGGAVVFVWGSVGGSVQRVQGGVVPVNEWSHIAVIVEDEEQVELRVNGKGNYFSTDVFRSSSTTNGLYIGGVNPTTLSAISDPILNTPYSGSLSELIANEINIDFANIRDISSTAIELGKCAPYFVPSPPPTLTPPLTTATTKTCAMSPQTLDDAFYFDGKVGSRLEFDHDDNAVIKSGFSIELELRTLSDDGIILFASNTNQKSYIYLRLDAGKLKFGYSASETSQSTESSELVNDGKWHTITMSRNLAEGQFEVDGRLKNVNLEKTEKISMPITTVFYVGSIPSDVDLNKLRELDGVGAFHGCVRNLKFSDTNGKTIDEKDWVSVERLGSTQDRKCYINVEKAAGFDGDTFAVAGERWDAPTPFMFQVTIRTTQPSGLLLSVGDKHRHVLVYINDTLVTLKAAKGKNIKLQAQLTSNAPVCDGEWHEIKTVVDNREVTLEVDKKNPQAKSIKDSKDNIMDSTTVYIGGSPGESRLIAVGNFVGCVKLEYVLDIQRSLQDALNVDELNLNECPVP